MQIEVVRHHRGAQHADGDVEHVRIGDDRRRGDDEILEYRPVLWPGQEQLHAEHRDDGADERNHQRLNITEAPALHEQDEQHIKTCDEHAIEEGNVKQKVEGDGRTDHFSQVAGGDSDFGADPEANAHPAAVGLVAHLSQIALSSYAKLE